MLRSKRNSFSDVGRFCEAAESITKSPIAAHDCGVAPTRRVGLQHLRVTGSALNNHSGFTLVELLSVIAVIALLITISVPSLNRISTSNALSNGTRQFSDQVAMARTYALANAKNVYLVVANNLTQNTTISNTYCYVAYGFCVSAVSSLAQASVNPLSQVTYIDAIQYLPQGAVFLNQVNNVSPQLVPFPNSTNTAVSVWCVQINSYGQIQPLTTPPTFYLTQGFVSGNGASTLPTATYPGTNTITINPLTGKAMITKN